MSERSYPDRKANQRMSQIIDIITETNQKCLELELELIQSHMAQKPMLRGEVGASVSLPIISYKVRLLSGTVPLSD